jgi:hypothetical protein
MTVETLLPYWLGLRNEALMFYEGRGLAKEWSQLKDQNLADREIWGRLAVYQVKRRKDGTPYHIPPDAEYRKAQEIIIRTLNGLVGKWQETNWNLAACFQKYPQVEHQVTRFLRSGLWKLMPSLSGPSVLAGPVGPFGSITLRSGRDNPTLRARRDALRLFVEVVRHPSCDRLRKCVRCHRYFFGRPSQKCCPRPRRCGSTLAAIEASKRNWRAARQQKLELARAQCVEWQRRRLPVDWKLWVAKQIGVSPKWVTRAINLGELTPPRDKYREEMASTTQKVNPKKLVLRRRNRR